MAMYKVIIAKPDDKKLDELGVPGWPVWEKEISVFNWNYDSDPIRKHYKFKN
ncbi:MAG: hypothetical protein ABH883_02430 [Candidatus Omnitrophota bacterium]